jgi:hypothetical protein
MGECDGFGAVHREVAVPRGVHLAMIPAQAAVRILSVSVISSISALRQPNATMAKVNSEHQSDYSGISFQA